MSFRNYKAESDVKETYKLARQNQSFEYANNMLFTFLDRKKEKINFWDVIDKLSGFIDKSDPDINIPNAHHLFQTAETARKDNMPEWFQLVCILHDMGKIMYLWGNDKDGTSVENQWGIVGDTFILGCKIPDSIVYPEFNYLNKHYNETKIGRYHQNIGLNMCTVSWGHDEFMYRVLRQNKNTIPEEGYYIVRYHSLYLWHDKNEYSYLESNKDKIMKPWVQKFNKYDLYTKVNLETDIEKLKEYYSKLVIKFFSTEELLW
jgi:inositol oxygenase